MRTWYYAVEISRWVMALIWSHALVACAVFVSYAPLTLAERSQEVAAWITVAAILVALFAMTGILWYVTTISPLRKFRRAFGFWPGRTEEEVQATRAAVTDTIRRRAQGVVDLFALADAMDASRIEYDAVRVDIDQAVNLFRATEYAAR